MGERKEFSVTLDTFSNAVDLLEALGFKENAPPDETHWNFSNEKNAFAEVCPVERVPGKKCIGYIKFCFN